MKFIKGEVKKIGIEVISQVGDTFIIETSDYSIVDIDTEEEIDRGYATIDGHKIYVLFSAQSIGRFNCIITYRISAEILKAKIYVEVI